MPHKLLIEVDAIPSDDHNGYLTPGEVVRGESSTFLITVSNLGAEEFPGGEISDIRFRFYEDYAQLNEVYQLSKLNANSETVLEPSLELVPYEVGLFWIDLKVSSSDGEPVECYQTRDGVRVGTDSWSNLFYSVSRENLAIIDLLKDLARRSEST